MEITQTAYGLSWRDPNTTALHYRHWPDLRYPFMGITSRVDPGGLHLRNWEPAYPPCPAASYTKLFEQAL